MPASGDTALFGGNQARDLQLAGQQLGQASDTLFALYERHAQDANDIRVQDLNNQFITGQREILRTGPNAYYNQAGADAVTGADAVAETLKKLGEQVYGQTANGYQRRKLRPILDAHFAVAADGIKRHVGDQQAAYERGVTAAAIQTSKDDAIVDPANLPNAVYRAGGAARGYNKGQPPEAVETAARAAGASVIAGVIGDRLAHDDLMSVTLFQQHAGRLDPADRRTLGAAAEMLSNSLAAAAWVRDRSVRPVPPAPTGDAALDAVNEATASAAAPPPVVSTAGRLLDQDGVAGTGQRLAEIDDRRRALTALNAREFAGNPVRRRANQAAIDADTACARAAVKAEVDSLHTAVRRHLTTGGPSGGPAVTAPPVCATRRWPPSSMSGGSDCSEASVEAVEGRAIAFATQDGCSPRASPARERAMSTRDLTAISRTLAHALRHEPWLYELELDAEGWTPVEAALAALHAERPEWHNLAAADFAEVIRSSAKKRYEMADGRIRALYGHSVPGRLSRTAAPPPSLLFHGTSPGALESIRRDGLQPMARQYVHLSPERADAVAVGRRKHPQPVILLVDSAAAAAAGHRFYAGNDKVWLADAVPWRFIALES